MYIRIPYRLMLVTDVGVILSDYATLFAKRNIQ